MRIAYIDPQARNTEYIYYSSFIKGLSLNDVEVDCFGSFSGVDPRKHEAVIFGLGFFGSESPSTYSHNASISSLSSIPKIAIIHKIKNHYEAKINFCRQNRIDTILTTTPFAKKIQEDSKIKTFTLPYCADEAMFKNLNIEKKYDIGFSGALHAGKKNGCEGELQDIRVGIQKILSARTDLKVFWNGTDRVETRIKSTEEYVKKINECKLWLCVTGPSYDVNPRFHEVPLCGTIPFINTIPKSIYNYYYVDQFTCGEFKNNLVDFSWKLDETLENYKWLKKEVIEFAEQNCTMKARGETLLSYIGI